MEATLTFISLTNYQEGTSAKGPWKKQEAVFETRDQYPKKIAVSAFNAMADTLAACTPQQCYDVRFDIDSREWNGKWYTDVRVFGIVAHATVPAGQQQPYTAQPPRSAPRPAQQAPQLPLDQQPGVEEMDDLPF